mmetsp:Transcript_34481/g.89880  ORF Transcript_34481/g.89880 Transcript_34481/m.89880 type:complete len:274 (-) Transcript_34481:544-1365(-)
MLVNGRELHPSNGAQGFQQGLAARDHRFHSVHTMLHGARGFELVMLHQSVEPDEQLGLGKSAIPAVVQQVDNITRGEMGWDLHFCQDLPHLFVLHAFCHFIRPEHAVPVHVEQHHQIVELPQALHPLQNRSLGMQHMVLLRTGEHVLHHHTHDDVGDPIGNEQDEHQDGQHCKRPGQHHRSDDGGDVRQGKQQHHREHRVQRSPEHLVAVEKQISQRLLRVRPAPQVLIPAQQRHQHQGAAVKEHEQQHHQSEHGGNDFPGSVEDDGEAGKPL